MGRVQVVEEIPVPQILELREENARLQQMVAELLLRNELLRSKVMESERPLRSA